MQLTEKHKIYITILLSLCIVGTVFLVFILNPSLIDPYSINGRRLKVLYLDDYNGLLDSVKNQQQKIEAIEVNLENLIDRFDSLQSKNAILNQKINLQNTNLTKKIQELNYRIYLLESE